MNKSTKTLLVWLGLGCAFLLLFQLQGQLQGEKKPEAYEDFEVFRQQLDEGQVAAIRFYDWQTVEPALEPALEPVLEPALEPADDVEGADESKDEATDEAKIVHEIAVTLKNSDERYLTTGVIDKALFRKISNQSVEMSWEGDGEESDFFLDTFVTWFPMLLLIGVWVFFMKKQGGGFTNAMSFAKSRARLISESSSTTFADVAGCQEAKDVFSDIIDFLKNAKRWTESGVRLPRGVLLEGPPGCGKTLLARAVAGETKAHFYCVSASEFVEMFVGVGAARIRDTFETALKKPPAVIFIDELDAIGRQRGSGIGPNNEEREQALNQLLVSMDGFERSDQVVVIAATNRPDILDKALLRAGRFDRTLRIPEPSQDVRLEMLQIHTRNKTLAEDVSLEEIAQQTVGYSGAEIEALTNEAALFAVRRARQSENEQVVLFRGDFLQALEPTDSQKKRFTKLDAVLIESATQLAEPTGQAWVRIHLSESGCVEGQVVWADACFIKVRKSCDEAEVLIPKIQIQTIEVLDGTELAKNEDVVIDPWASRTLTANVA